MKITGILSVSNGSGLQYPYPVVVHNLQRMCDNVIVGVDPNFPTDRETLEMLELPNVSVVDFAWDLSNRDGGSEIAIQMDHLTDLAKEQGSDWVVVMQADELIHDDDFQMLRTFMSRSPKVTGFKMKRLYFWKDLNTLRDDWDAQLVRIFRPGTYSFMAENTDKSGMYAAQTSPGEEVELPYFIYHYSRVDAPEVISKRIRNMDTLFHDPDTLIAEEDLPGYDFKTRPFDNYSKVERIEEIEGKFSSFDSTHPDGVTAWFSK